MHTVRHSDIGLDIDMTAACKLVHVDLVVQLLVVVAFGRRSHIIQSVVSLPTLRRERAHKPGYLERAGWTTLD